MCIRKRILGLVLLSMGTGMLLVTLIPFWGFIVAAIIAIIGVLFLFDN